MTTQLSTETPAGIDTTKLPLDGLWQLRDEASAEIKALYEYRTGLDAELDRRFKASHPEYSEESGGSVELAGNGLIVKLTYSRDYAWNNDVLLELQAARDGEGNHLITEAEWDKLVKVEMTGNGTAYNTLMRRGGAIAELLSQARFLKRATPKFEAVVRA